MAPIVPVLGFAAFSGTGTTTLLTQLIPLLRERGLRVGVIKRSHHGFEIDAPGKDSHTLRQAGAMQMLIVSARRTVFLTEHATGRTLGMLLRGLQDTRLDLILVEGCRRHIIPKIELHRPSLGHPLLCIDDPVIVAVATDAALPRYITVPLLDLNDPVAIAAFILERLNAHFLT